MAASKKVSLRMGWSGDQFHLEGVQFDGDGAWDKDGKPVTFTEAEAVAVVREAHKNNVTLVPADDGTESDTASSGGSPSGQEG